MPRRPRDWAFMPRHRRRRLALITLAAVVAGILPPLLVLAITWRQAVRDADLRLDRYGELLERRIDDVFGAADVALAELAARVDRDCTPATLEALRRTVYDSLYFRDAGLVLDNRMVCSSTGRHDPPIAIANPEQRAWPADGIHITAPTVTSEQAVSIVVLRGGGPQAPRGFAVSLLVNPRELLEPIRAAIEQRSIELRVERADGAVLARAGNAAVTPGPDTLVRSHLSAHYPLTVTVSGSRNELIDGWWDDASLFVGLGLLISLPLFGLLLVLDRRERSLDAQLRDAIDDGELMVHYQPIHAADGLAVVGAEALLRWQHPERGLMLPGGFVPTAEQSGLIIPLTHWLMQQVRDDLEALRERHPAIYLGINLSPQHFADEQLPRQVRELFGPACAAGRLLLEVTERELMTAPHEVARRVIAELRGSGARIALDDFGTGHSSLASLGGFDVDLLKIDKSFIDAIGTGSVTAGLVEDIVAIARRLGLKTIAEGVETDAQLQRLQAIGVDYLQGWRLSAALPLDQLLAYLDRHRPQG